LLNRILQQQTAGGIMMKRLDADVNELVGQALYLYKRIISLDIDFSLIPAVLNPGKDNADFLTEVHDFFNDFDILASGEQALLKKELTKELRLFVKRELEYAPVFKEHAMRIIDKEYRPIDVKPLIISKKELDDTMSSKESILGTLERFKRNHS
jgi:hypothetical protein